MAKAKRWTDEKLKSQRPNEGSKDSRFRIEPSLYLRVREWEAGRITRHWEYRAQVAGQRRRWTVGEYPAMTLAEAREALAALERKHLAARKGEADHPVIAARAEVRDRRAQLSVAETFDLWIADKRLGSPRKRGEPVRDRTINVLTENFDADVRGKIGEAKIAHVTPEMLRECIDAPRKRGAPGAAAQVYRLLRGLVTFAIKRGHVASADPMRGIENPRPYKPQPVIAANDGEIVALLRGLEASRLWPATKLAIQFQVLTGARPGEVRLAEWKDVRLDRGLWTIPADLFKTGRAFTVHLSTEALDVLEQAKALRQDKQKEKPGEKAPPDPIFPGANGGHMEKMAVGRALSRLAERTKDDGAKHLRPHDLRRTFRTMLSRIGVAPHIAELCLGHVERETMRRVYDGHDYSGECAEAWAKAGAHVAALRAGGAQVIPLYARASR